MSTPQVNDFNTVPRDAFKETNWIPFTSPVVGGLGIVSSQGWWKQRGDSLFIQLYFNANAASGAELRVYLPNNFKTPPKSNDFKLVNGFGFINTRPCGYMYYPSNNGNTLTAVVQPAQNYITFMQMVSTFWNQSIVGTNVGAGEYGLVAEVPIDLGV